ncbi:DUF3331 domain-containing protein [Paraburkholderia jirisanensis]
MNDPWNAIVWGLVESGAAMFHVHRKGDGCSTGAHRASFQCVSTSGLVVSRIEWQTDCTILVSWSDPTRGRYVDQIWRMGYARGPGACLLSGVRVTRGDQVFRPLFRKGAEPPNASDMILSTTVIPPAA